MEWVVLDDVHLLEGFTDVYVVRYDFVGHREAFGREKLRAIFELIDLKFPPQFLIRFCPSVRAKP